MAIETKSEAQKRQESTAISGGVQQKENSPGALTEIRAAAQPMDRMTRSFYRLWGSLSADGRLHDSPLFAEELAERCKHKLDLQVKSVSKWSFGKQLEHLYLSTHYVLDRLEEALAGQNPTGRMGLYG